MLGEASFRLDAAAQLTCVVSFFVALVRCVAPFVFCSGVALELVLLDRHLILARHNNSQNMLPARSSSIHFTGSCIA